MVYMYHSFLVHSSADGHLGCFHVLAMTNSDAMNIGVHESLSDLVSSVCMPRSGNILYIIYITDSFFCTPETNKTLYISYISIEKQNYMSQTHACHFCSAN